MSKRTITPTTLHASVDRVPFSSRSKATSEHVSARGAR